MNRHFSILLAPKFKGSALPVTYDIGELGCSDRPIKNEACRRRREVAWASMVDSGYFNAIGWTSIIRLTDFAQASSGTSLFIRWIYVASVQAFERECRFQN